MIKNNRTIWSHIIIINTSCRRCCFIALLLCYNDSFLHVLWALSSWCYNLKSLEWDKGQTLVLEKTQENLIESSLQNSLLYILLQMVHASYCTPYPKWPCVKHEVNMWCPYCMMSFCSRTFYSLLLSPMINAMTTPSNVTDVTVWPITSNPNPRVLKIERWKIKINWKENKMRKKMKKKLSPHSLILTHGLIL